jgi:hypothetical protein
MDVWCKQGCVGSQLITPQFQPPFRGMLDVASGQYDPGKHRTSNTPIELCGGNYSPLQRPQEPMRAKLLQYCALCGMALNTKSMRSLPALLLHNMYMLQNCSSAIINSIGNIIQALYKALFVIWDELEQLIQYWACEEARWQEIHFEDQNLSKYCTDKSFSSSKRWVYPMMDALVYGDSSTLPHTP